MNKITNKADILKKHLLYGITTGVLREGDRLSGERQLSEKHDISRNTVRQAIDELVEEGVLERRPRSGAYISSHALDIISSTSLQPALKVTFVFQPEQAGNALLMQLFQSCCANLDPQVKVILSLHLLSHADLEYDFDCDVMVSFGCIDRELLRKLRDKHHSLVLLNQQYPEFNYLAVDDIRGGEMLAEYVAGCGHRDIGVLSFDPNTSSRDFEDRQKGFVRVLENAGISYHPAMIWPDSFHKIEPYCFQEFVFLNRLYPKMSAMLCTCDMMALGIMRSCEILGLKVPADMSVAGFDDQIYARYTQPGLTTMKYPAEAIGIRLADYINDMLDGKENRIQELMNPLLIKRESIKNLNT